MTQRYIHRHRYLGNARVALYGFAGGELRIETIRRSGGARQSRATVRFFCGYTQALSRTEAAAMLLQVVR